MNGVKCSSHGSCTAQGFNQSWLWHATSLLAPDTWLKCALNALNDPTALKSSTALKAATASKVENALKAATSLKALSKPFSRVFLGILTSSCFGP